MNGKVEYYKRPGDFFTMPKFDIRSINNAMFFNPSKDTQADLFAKFIKDQCEKDFPLMRTAKGRLFVSTCIIDPVKKEPWVYYKDKDDLNDIDMILDPMDLLKYGKDDMMKLHKSSIKVYDGWDEEAKPFTRAVAFAIELKLYARVGPHSITLPIG
ncbi:hypothetical protein E3N88_32395 [Mikania micrantha]|uniref:Uncharacterized protein n=1 Tax=Mikania micrantha TaxID=192012 RepID=A0A5N6M8X6_9ASTR|nr:hypothetical protein E3N88_32395 [Mikania micrantha]